MSGVVEAGQFNVPANVYWYHAPVQLPAGSILNVQADPHTVWAYVRGGEWLNADGDGNAQPPYPAGLIRPDQPPGKLLIRLTENSEIYAIGTEPASFTISTDLQQVQVSMNDVPGAFADNSGGMTVNYTVDIPT